MNSLNNAGLKYKDTNILGRHHGSDLRLQYLTSFGNTSFLHKLNYTHTQTHRALRDQSYILLKPFGSLICAKERSLGFNHASVIKGTF